MSPKTNRIMMVVEQKYLMILFYSDGISILLLQAEVTIPAAWQPELTVASNNGTSATVQWTLPKGKLPERFELTWYNNDESNEAYKRTTLSNEYRISLKPGCTYMATVVGVNSSGNLKPSNPITIRAKPLAVADVTLASNPLSNTDSIIAKWTGMDARVTKYQVTAIELSTGMMISVSCVNWTHTFTGIKSGSLYRVYVEAILPEEAEQEELISERAFSQEDIQTYPAKVQNLKGEAVASSSYNFSWDTVIGATYYEFALKNYETNYVTHLTDHPEFVCSGLQLGMRYTAKVAAINGAGKGKYSGSVQFATIPRPVTDIQVTNYAAMPHECLVVTFKDDNTKTDRYRVVAQALSSGDDTVQETDKPSALVKGLKPGETYNIYVVVFDKEALRSSKEYYQDRVQTYPAVPEDTKLVFTDNQLEFTWKYPTFKPDHHKVTWTANGAAFSAKVLETRFNLNNLSPSMTYSFSVAAVNQAGTGEASDVQEYITGPETPPAIRVNIDKYDFSVLHVNITEPAIKPDLYVFQLIENGIEYKQHAVQKPSHTFFCLKPAREYSVSVHSQTGGLESKKRYSSSIQTCPEKVHGLELAGRTNSSLTVKWDETPGAVSYRVRWTDEGQNQKLQKTELTKCVIDSLEPGKNYDISVTATNRIESGKCSDELSVRMVPRPVTEVQVTNYAAMPHECLVVTFKDYNTKNNGYRVVAQALSSGDETVRETDQPSALIKGLKPGETYNIYVVVFDEEDLRSSKEYYQDTVQTYPAAPEDTKLVFTDNQLEFTWKCPTFKPDHHKVTWTANGAAFSAKVLETRFVLNNLSPSTTYSFSVAAVNQAGMGEASDVQEYITAPGRPVDLTSKTTSPSEVLFTCKPHPGATSYEFTIISEGHEENPEPYTRITQSSQLRYRCTGIDTKFQAYVRAINGGGIGDSSDVLKFRQVLRHLQLKFLNQAKNHLPQEKFIMPELATLPDQKISNDFKACINPGDGETVLMVGGLFCGKTACCTYFLQTQDLKQLCLLLDYDLIKSVEQDFTAKTDIKSLLWKYMPDITSEEMDFVYQWMKEHSQHVTLVVDNFALPDDFQVKHIQHEDKETPQVLFYNLLKTNRDIFPKSHIFCTTSQISLSSWLKPTASYRMHGFDDDGVTKMRLRVSGLQNPTSSNIDIPNQIKYFYRHPGSCETVLRLLQQNRSTSDKPDCTSLASLLVEVLSQNLARHSGQDKAMRLKQLYKEIMKVPSNLYNTKSDPQKIKVKEKRRKFSPLESNDDCSSYSNVSSVLESPQKRNAMSSLLPSCDILHDICLKALYFGVFAADGEFKKHFSRRKLRFPSASHMWIMTAGMLRQHTLKKAMRLFEPVTKINMKECEKKAEGFKSFIKENMKDILTSVYTDSQTTLDWFACCAELDDDRLLKTCSPEIKINTNMSTAALEEVENFLENVPRQFCRQVKIKVKEGTDVNKTLIVDMAIRNNPYGRLFRNESYKQSSIRSLSRKMSQRYSLNRNDGRNEAKMSTTTTIPEEGSLNSEDTKGSSVTVTEEKMNTSIVTKKIVQITSSVGRSYSESSAGKKSVSGLESCPLKFFEAPLIKGFIRISSGLEVDQTSSQKIPLWCVASANTIKANLLVQDGNDWKELLDFKPSKTGYIRLRLQPGKKYVVAIKTDADFHGINFRLASLTYLAADRSIVNEICFEDEQKISEKTHMPPTSSFVDQRFSLAATEGVTLQLKSIPNNEIVGDWTYTLDVPDLDEQSFFKRHPINLDENDQKTLQCSIRKGRNLVSQVAISDWGFKLEGGATEISKSSVDVSELPETALYVELLTTANADDRTYQYTAISRMDGHELSTTTTKLSAILGNITPGDHYDIFVLEVSKEGSLTLVSKSQIQTAKLVGRSGGHVAVGGCSITFPKDSVEDGTRITITPCMQNVPPLPDKFTSIGPVLDLCSTQKTFYEPANCNFTTSCRCEGEPIPVSILCFENGKWEEICSTFLTNKGVVSFKCEHFTPFAVAAPMDAPQERMQFHLCYFVYLDKNDNIRCVTCKDDNPTKTRCETNLRKSNYFPSPFVATSLTMKKNETVEFSLTCQSPLPPPPPPPTPPPQPPLPPGNVDDGGWKVQLNNQFTSRGHKIHSAMLNGVQEPQKIVLLLTKTQDGEEAEKQKVKVDYPWKDESPWNQGDHSERTTANVVAKQGGTVHLHTTDSHYAASSTQ